MLPAKESAAAVGAPLLDPVLLDGAAPPLFAFLPHKHLSKLLPVFQQDPSQCILFIHSIPQMFHHSDTTVFLRLYRCTIKYDVLSLLSQSPRFVEVRSTASRILPSNITTTTFPGHFRVFVFRIISFPLQLPHHNHLSKLLPVFPMHSHH